MFLFQLFPEYLCLQFVIDFFKELPSGLCGFRHKSAVVISLIILYRKWFVLFASFKVFSSLLQIQKFNYAASLDLFGVNVVFTYVVEL